MSNKFLSPPHKSQIRSGRSSPKKPPLSKHSVFTASEPRRSLNEEPSIRLIPMSPRTRRFPSSVESAVKKELTALNENTKTHADKQEQLNLLLMDCATQNLPELCEHLLTTGEGDLKANASFQGYRGQTPLHVAAAGGHQHVCQLLIQHGRYSTLDIPDEAQMTPLHLACLRNHPSLVRLLMRSGADLNVQDKAGNSPIHYIVRNRNIDLFQFLLRQDANLRLMNYEGHTPVDLAKFARLGDEVCLLNVTPAAVRPPSKDLIDDEVRSDSSGASLSSFEAEESDIELSEGTTDLFDFEIVKAIKKVSYGEIVYLVKHSQTNRFFAMKVIRKAKLSERNLYMKYALTERQILSKVKHTFINNLRCSYQTEGFLYMIMDYNPGGDLKRLMTKEGPMSEERAVIYLAEVVLAIETLHRTDIVYRNLKPQSVELDQDGHVKLTNFGLAKEGVTGPRQANSFFLSYTHLAPEVLDSVGHGKAVDWYMLGGLLYELLVGEPAFATAQKNEMIRNIKQGPLVIPKTVTPVAASLIEALMQRDLSLRLQSAEEVKGHAFFAGIDWGLLAKRRILTPPVDFQDMTMTSVADSFFSRNSSMISADLSYIQGWNFSSELS